MLKKDEKKRRKVVVVGTLYGLLLYLLYVSEKDFFNSIFFLNRQYTFCASALPECILINNLEPGNNSVSRRLISLLWGLSLRLKRATLWRKYFNNEEIYAQDQFSFAPPLISRSDYILISDGFNSFERHMQSEMFKISSSWCKHISFKKKVLRFIFGPTWMGWFGLNKQCKGLLHENPVQIPYASRKLELFKVDILQEWQKASENKKNYICNVFAVDKNELRLLSSKKVFLLAQPFENDSLDEEELVEIYKKALAFSNPSDIVIKTHHRSTLDYEKYFPDCFVFKKNIPMQLLVMCGIKNMTHAVTISSTAVSMFPPDVTVVWLGMECHPKLLARYGTVLPEDIVFRAEKIAAENASSIV